MQVTPIHLPASQSDIPHVAYALDSGYVMPMCVALHALFRHRQGPVHVSVVGHALTNDDKALIKKTARQFSNATLDLIDFEEFGTETGTVKAHLTMAMMIRLNFPNMFDGRVIYMDPDTLLVTDILSLWQTDLGGHALAAAKDIGVQSQLYAIQNTKELQRRRDRASRHMAEMREVHEDINLETYFNSGVLIMDCDRLRADTKLMSDMQRFDLALSFPLPDQDLLNLCFGDNYAELSMTWNRFAGGVREYAIKPTLKEVDGRAPINLYHYSGRIKPWHNPREWKWRNGLTHMLRWRCEAFRWRRSIATDS